MTVRELRKVLRELNPDAVVMAGKNKDTKSQDIYDIVRIICHCPNDIKDPWRADYVGILYKEGEKEDE